MSLNVNPVAAAREKHKPYTVNKYVYISAHHTGNDVSMVYVLMCFFLGSLLQGNYGMALEVGSRVIN